MSKDRVLVVLIVFAAGYSFFGPANAIMEVRLLQHPSRLAWIPILLACVLLGIRYRERRIPAADRTLLFEDRPAPTIQVLNLSR